MIDYIVKFNTEDAASKHEVWGEYYNAPTEQSPGGWNPTCAIGGLLIWDPAEDVADPETGGVTHTPIDTQFYLMVSLPAEDPDLTKEQHTQLVADREACEVIKTKFSAAQMQTLMMQPVFVGSAYPFLTPEGRGLLMNPVKGRKV